jgi:hypothetical protein
VGRSCGSVAKREMLEERSRRPATMIDRNELSRIAGILASRF